MEIRLGQKVRHKEIYNGKETMEVAGIKKGEVLLKGDFSGGTHNVEQESWMPTNGLITQNIWGAWTDPDDDFFERITKNAVFNFFKRKTCSHLFSPCDMQNRDENGNVKWKCFKCNKIFIAECGLDILKNGKCDGKWVS